jgi:hypothetical protein
MEQLRGEPTQEVENVSHRLRNGTFAYLTAFTLGRKLIFVRYNFKICVLSAINLRNLGPDLSKLSISDDKYSSSVSQDMIDVTGRESIPSLLAASYASSSWKKFTSFAGFWYPTLHYTALRNTTH